MSGKQTLCKTCRFCYSTAEFRKNWSENQCMMAKATGSGVYEDRLCGEYKKMWVGQCRFNPKGKAGWSIVFGGDWCGKGRK